jgi:HD superfamily phosphodiesterase
MFVLLVLSACGWATVGQAQDATRVAHWRVEVADFASKHFKHPAWGVTHSRRVYALARELAGADGATVDDDILFAAAYLHDMAAFPPWDAADLDHSDVGADTAVAVLTDAGFPAAKIGAVQAAIRTHMYYREPMGPEATYLHDADALDWLGAVGAARVLALVDSKGGEPTAAEMVKKLETNLAQVPEAVVSNAGRAQLAHRTRVLEGFLEALREETRAFTDL